MFVKTEDLDRLMSIYQFWAHNMFPKTQFRDTIDRVERVCRSRRMLVRLSVHMYQLSLMIRHPSDQYEYVARCRELVTEA